MQGLLTTIAGLSVGGVIIWTLVSWEFSPRRGEEENPPPLGGPDMRGVFLVLPGIIAGVATALLSYYIQKSGGVIGSVGVIAGTALLATTGARVALRFRKQ